MIDRGYGMVASAVGMPSGCSIHRRYSRPEQKFGWGVRVGDLGNDRRDLVFKEVAVEAIFETSIEPPAVESWFAGSQE
jgi:hypothetical protein